MSIKHQTVAMACVVQHARLVDQLARTGSANFEELEFCLQQLFIFEHTSTAEAFGDAEQIRPGLQLLNDLLKRSSNNHAQAVLQYTVALVHLERKLSANKDMLNVIRNRLEHASYRNEHFSTDGHTVAENLAGIYQDTLSTLSYRIQIKGNMQHLQDEHTANCIRALLLCAVRALRLWRLEGGSRLKLILGRGRYSDCCEAMLNEQ